MRALLLFESCSGNTKFATLIAESTLKNRGWKVDTYRMKDINPYDLADYDIYGFGIPVHSWAPVKPCLDFVSVMQEKRNKPCFVYSTAGGAPSRANAMMSRRLIKKGFAVLGDHWIFFPDSWPLAGFTHIDILNNLPSKRGMKKFVSFVEEMASKASDFNSGHRWKLPSYRPYPSLTFPFSFWASIGGLKYGLGKRIVLSDVCTQCRLCEKACPSKAISVKNVPEFNESLCIGCWGCFNICPETALRSSIAKEKHFYGGLIDPDGKLESIGIGSVENNKRKFP